MPDENPLIGLVIRYAFLWSDQALRGAIEGVKDRPCVVIVATRRRADGRWLVRVLPITTRPPDDPDGTMTIPVKVRRHLGLDAEESWIVLTEMNQFIWPGPDIRPLPGRLPTAWSYGTLPADFFDQLLDRLARLYSTRTGHLIRRPEN